MKKLLTILFALLLPVTASAVYIVDQGGTGSTTLTGILKGNGKSMVQTAIGGTDYVLPSALSSYLSLSSWYATNTDALHEGSTNLYYTNPRVQTYLDTLSKGYFYSTTSADYWLTTKSLTAASSTLYGDNGLFTGTNVFTKFITAPYFTATSTTATSTFAGDITMGQVSVLNNDGGANRSLLKIVPTKTYGSGSQNQGDGALLVSCSSSNGLCEQVTRNNASAVAPLALDYITNASDPYTVRSIITAGTGAALTLSQTNSSASQATQSITNAGNGAGLTINMIKPTTVASALRLISTSTQAAATTLILQQPSYVTIAFENLSDCLGNSLNVCQIANGKFQLTARNDTFRFEGRRDDNSQFDVSGMYRRPSSGGNWLFGGWQDTPQELYSIPSGSGLVNIVASSSTIPDFFDVTSTTTVGRIGDVFSIKSNGNLGIGTTSPYAKLSVVGETVSAFFTATTTSNNTFPNLISTNSTTTNGTTTNFAVAGNVAITGRTVIGNPTITPNIPVFIETNQPSNGFTTMAIKNTASDGRAQMTFSAGAQDYYEGFIGMSGPTVTNATSTMEIGCGSALCKLNFWAGGQERARFGENGYFSIATTSTQLFPLHVAQEGLAALFGKLENVSTYLGFTYNRPSGFPRAVFGYNAGTGNAVVQGGLSKGIELNVNNNTLGSGNVMNITSGGNVGVGSTSPWAKLSVQGTSGQYNDIFSVASSSLQSLFNVNYKGYIGIGSSTPWGVLSIIDPMNDRQPGIVMATSSGATVFWGATASTSDALGDPVRMLVGWGTKFISNFDTFAQLSVNGEINTNNTISLECRAEGMKKTAQITSGITGSVISTTLGYPCGDFSYIEDTAGVADFVAGTTGNYIRLRTGAAGTIAGAGDGMGLALTTAGLYTATNTPLKLEVSARPVVNNATSTLYLLGLFNTTGVSANYAAMPTAGCGFVASTTQANWRAFCGTGSAYTYLDTGIASTTNIATPSNGAFTRFRVEMGKTYATFRYLRGSVGDTNSWVTIGSISTNYPNTAALNPTVAVGGVTAKISDELQVRFIRAWYNDPEPY